MIALVRRNHDLATKTLTEHAVEWAQNDKACAIVRDSLRIGFARTMRRTPDPALLNALVNKLTSTKDFGKLLANTPWTARGRQNDFSI